MPSLDSITVCANCGRAIERCRCQIVSIPVEFRVEFDIGGDE